MNLSDTYSLVGVLFTRLEVKINSCQFASMLAIYRTDQCLVIAKHCTVRMQVSTDSFGFYLLL